ncbi:ShlB/FhaC/HecB family hemolysin secretion/activation protein [Pantoea sp. Tr-811]|uniref:ShlB/FhaC/HecB family hemolysin secretion/activation protein n=1 Tax=unclassified Pantoea TaxID=2630326 RepID=UPI0014239402|nr:MULTISPECIES: ShlB/FhaC/HecB family hemolysin secretion/activation protein [unclassified Pantoea]NIE76171.1 ShlB/FhaC/HecB family hemolysin secretion/activation protein [Pantoea sp. Ap-967]NIF26960.1 ShlB/FhaC/HecB family hemolysin secretion/activation protein [Pantoea sp. Tr-811]
MFNSHVPAKALLCALGFAVMTANAAMAAETAAAAAPAQAAQARVQVNAVEFSGNRTFSNEQLNAQIAGDLGRPMTLVEMKALAAKVEAYYQAANYRLVKVVVPAQDFANEPALKLVVLEGWLGNVQVTGAKRFSAEQVHDALAAGGVVEGKPFTLEQVERALTHLNRLSGIEVTSTLQPGQQTGSTDLVVDVTEAPRIQGAMEINNYGSKDTGETRLMPSLKFANLTGHGDEANVLALTSLGAGDLWYGYVDYSLPLNATGTKARAYFSKGNVDVGNTYRVLEIEGENQSWGLGMAQDFVRSARSIVTAEAWLEAQDLDQSILGVRTAEDKVRKLRFTVSLDNSDLYGRTLATMGLHYGLGEALGGMDDNSTMSSRAAAKADNNFTKVTFDVARLQQITPRFLVIPRIAGQYSFDSLVSSEQWGVGGFNSVAGHAPSTYSGDNGFTASLEGRYALFKDSDRYQATARLDHGQVWVKDPLVGQEKHQDLSGAAIGLLARPLDCVDLRVDFGVPIGTKTEDNSYVYAQARYHF